MKPVCKRGSILLGEMVAIQLVLIFMSQNNVKRSLKIFCDSQSVIGLLTLGWSPSSHHQTIKETKDLLQSLSSQNVEVEIVWTPGHVDIRGNDLADSLAKEAATEARDKDIEAPYVTLDDVSTAARRSVSAKWQRQWDRADTGRRLYGFKPMVSLKNSSDISSRHHTSIISQLRTGYCQLNRYRHRLGFTPSPRCECDLDNESVAHYLLDCPLYDQPRHQLILQTMTLTNSAELSEELLLGNHHLEEEIKNLRSDISGLLATYIDSTSRFRAAPQLRNSTAQ